MSSYLRWRCVSRKRLTCALCLWPQETTRLISEPGDPHPHEALDYSQSRLVLPTACSQPACVPESIICMPGTRWYRAEPAARCTACSPGHQRPPLRGQPALLQCHDPGPAAVAVRGCVPGSSACRRPSQLVWHLPHVRDVAAACRKGAQQTCFEHSLCPWRVRHMCLQVVVHARRRLLILPRAPALAFEVHCACWACCASASCARSRRRRV